MGVPCQMEKLLDIMNSINSKSNRLCDWEYTWWAALCSYPRLFNVLLSAVDVILDRTFDRSGRHKTGRDDILFRRRFSIFMLGIFHTHVFAINNYFHRIAKSPGMDTFGQMKGFSFALIGWTTHVGIFCY